ncbi:MAG: hypothetical protein ACKOZY_03665 [Flavobacteriales bacterium]
MKNYGLAFFWLLTAIASSAQQVESFTIQGDITQADWSSGEIKPASNCQVVVYEGRDIYVAFFADEEGHYQFELPFGKEYTVWFGGSSFVNQLVAIYTHVPQKIWRRQTYDLNLTLFQPVDFEDFDLLNEPLKILEYSTEGRLIVERSDYGVQKEKEMEATKRRVQREIKKNHKD